MPRGCGGWCFGCFSFDHFRRGLGLGLLELASRHLLVIECYSLSSAGDGARLGPDDVTALGLRPLELLIFLDGGGGLLPRAFNDVGVPDYFAAASGLALNSAFFAGP